ncbi:ATP-binding protein [Symbioplanes lichenis]|uniref:ATP-binding protein n=1 Tax=Symbioplanes lichenis TaxID=1629072 RepID=UPI002738A26B|nr:ATP-binding protein [Actinoplanes lichenis]
MHLSASLSGRLRNTVLPRSHGLLPLFEAVVNAIQSLDAASGDAGSGLVTVEIGRAHQMIRSFTVTDDGAGFHEENAESFATLDTEYKAGQGCRGVGRLLWLKAFDDVEISSVFRTRDGRCMERFFTFSAEHGVSGGDAADIGSGRTGAVVTLRGFRKLYREASPKTAEAIARSLLEHCLWYFVRPGGCPPIVVIDGPERIGLTELFHDFLVAPAEAESLDVRGRRFEVVHLRTAPRGGGEPRLLWCAAGRVVTLERLAGKIPGLYGPLDAGFGYSCYVTAPFLDGNVRSERTGFDVPETVRETLFDDELTMSEIRAAILTAAERHLGGLLDEAKRAARARVEDFVRHRAPRYRPILRHIDLDQLGVGPRTSEQDLESLLHRQLWELESDLLARGRQALDVDVFDDSHENRRRLADYLAKIDDIKKSDLAAYVFRRRVVLDVLAKAIQADRAGKYVREDVIHNLIMPMRTTSDDVSPDVCNLWILDERLAFHDFLASDKPLAGYSIIDSAGRERPDLVALRVWDAPVLVSEGKRLPLASLAVVEIKRPMRADAKQDDGPALQALDYLEKIRQGKVRTAQGRPIPASDDIPGFCYVLSDLTPSVVRECKRMGLKRTQDGLGFFGHNENYQAYIEVFSFDRLLNSAHERNRAFFDKLGLPV